MEYAEIPRPVDMRFVASEVFLFSPAKYASVEQNSCIDSHGKLTADHIYKCGLHCEKGAMIRVLTFILALLLALPAPAHSFDAVEMSHGCQSRFDAIECNSKSVDSALGSDTRPLGEETRSKKSAHRQMHCAIIAELNVPTIAPETQEHDIEFKPVLLFDIGYVVPRPPDARA
ncbi:MAG: hypothetical protein Q8O63_13890 [Hoeflea sp.]|nr:hypothetical protein [Hoeflea sp.]